MHYLNQRKYPHIPYPTNVSHGGVPPEKQTAAAAACGPCCLCMAVDILTDKSLGLEECLALSMENGANHVFGTDLTILAPTVAKKYGLSYSSTNDLAEVIAHLQAGGNAVALIGKGLFANGRHYILLTAFDGTDFCILDPSYTPDKFERPDRVGKVNTERAPFLYCERDTVHAETDAEFTKYYLLKRRKR